MPFQCVTSTPGTSVVSVFRGDTQETRYFRSPACVELFDAERQIGEFPVIDRRQDVVGVQVAEPDEDVDHLRLELALVERLVAQPQQPQPLDRIDGVQRPLERQVARTAFRASAAPGRSRSGAADAVSAPATAAGRPALAPPAGRPRGHGATPSRARRRACERSAGPRGRSAGVSPARTRARFRPASPASSWPATCESGPCGSDFCVGAISLATARLDEPYSSTESCGHTFRRPEGRRLRENVGVDLHD